MVLSTSGVTAVTQVGTSTWVDVGGGGGSGSNTNFFLSSTSSRGRKVSNAVRGFLADVGAGGVDISNEMILIRWATLAGIGQLNTKAAGGVRVRITSDALGTNNFQEWYVDGNDTYTGGWRESIIDPNKPPSAVTGTLDLTAARLFGMVWDETATVGGGDDNCYIDEVLRIANTGITVTGTSTSFWADMKADDDTNLYGVIQERGGVFYVLGNVTIGGGAVTDIEDAGVTVVFENQTYDPNITGHFTDVPNLTPELTGLTVTRAASATNVDFGTKVGSGASAVGTSGVSFIDDGLPWTLDVSDADIDAVNFYGCTFSGAKTPLMNDAASEAISCTFNNCTMVDPNEHIIRKCFFANSPELTNQQLTQVTADNGGTLTDETEDADDAGASDALLPVAATTDFGYFGFRLPYDQLDFDIGTAWTGSPVFTWEYWSGSAWSSLSGVTGGATFGGSTGANTVSWTRPGDWATTTVTGVQESEALYFVRYDVTTAGSADASATTITCRRNDAALDWESTTLTDIEDSDFINNTRAVQIDATGTYTWTNIRFAGNTTDLRNESGGLVTVNVTDGDSPSFENVGGSTTTVNNTVNVTITVLDSAQAAIQDAAVYVQDAAGPFDDVTQIIRELTNVSGVATESFNFVTDLSVTVRVRKRGFVPINQIQTITNQGLDITVTLQSDPNQE